MPELPIYFDHPESSLKAAMVFPEHDERARVFAAWLIIKNLSDNRAQGLGDSYDFENEQAREEMIEAACLAADFCYIYEDAQRNSADGLWAGIVTVCLWTLIHRRKEVASWESAIKVAEAYFRKHRELPASRAVFRDCLARFGPVLHLLAARTLRRGDGDAGFDRMIDLTAVPGVGYSRAVDALFFAAEAKELSRGLRQWDSARAIKSKYLDTMLEVGDSWNPPPRRLEWPDTGTLRSPNLDPWIEIVRRRPGRPKTLS